MRIGKERERHNHSITSHSPLIVVQKYIEVDVEEEGEELFGALV